MSEIRPLVTASALAIAGLLLGAVPAGATTLTVRPGESIQAAIDASSPGDTVLVEPGTYREYLQIVDKDRITLEGRKAALMPSSEPSTTLCSQPPEPMPTGVCVAGRVDLSDPENPVVLRPSVGDRVTGLRIVGYGANGIFAFGTDRFRADHNNLSGNGDYGAFSNTSTHTRFDHNTVQRNRGEAGLYVGDSQSAHAVVTRNKVTDNHGAGIFLRDVSHGLATRNTISGNCSGIFLLADAPGPAGHWSIGRNTVLRNNKECKATSEGDERTPPLSGLGIVLAGADHTSVTSNVVHGQQRKHPSATYGGIVVTKGDKTKPTRDLISRNVATRNSPDINWDRTGSVSFSHNTCQQSKPASVCP